MSGLICKRCNKRIDRNRNHYVSGWDRWHIRCWNEIEKERREKAKREVIQ